MDKTGKLEDGLWRTRCQWGVRSSQVIESQKWLKRMEEGFSREGGKVWLE